VSAHQKNILASMKLLFPVLCSSVPAASSVHNRSRINTEIKRVLLKPKPYMVRAFSF